jgi:hypothetical protein
MFAAICCISGTELRDINGLVLIFFRAARASTRARDDGKWALRKAMPMPASSGMLDTARFSSGAISFEGAGDGS